MWFVYYGPCIRKYSLIITMCWWCSINYQQFLIFSERERERETVGVVYVVNVCHGYWLSGCVKHQWWRSCVHHSLISTKIRMRILCLLQNVWFTKNSNRVYSVLVWHGSVSLSLIVIRMLSMRELVPTTVSHLLIHNALSVLWLL